MLRSLVVCVLLTAGATAAHAQAGAATVDPGMTKAQVIERLGAPAAERARGTYTYLFYQNGCERECGMADLVTLESDTVVDAIFRAPFRHYAGISSSPAATTPEGARMARARGGALAVPGRGAARETPASMAAEFAELFGNPAPAATPDETIPAPAVATESAAQPAAPSSMAEEIADLLGTTPSPAAGPKPSAGETPSVSEAAAQQPARTQDAASVLPPEVAALLGNPVSPSAPDTEKPKATPAAPKPEAKPAPSAVLSPEISALLGNPAPPANAAKPVGNPAASSILGEDITSLLRDPAAPPSADSSAKPTGRPPVQEPSRPDTIKSSGSTTWSTWPPPRDTAAARPPIEKPAEQPRPAAPDSTKAKEKSKGRTWTTWPPPPM